MKKLLTFFLLAFLAVSANAQRSHPYDEGFKYGFPSNCSLSAMVHYAYQDGSNVGIDIMAGKRLTEGCNLRLVGGINGFVPVKGFDRAGFVMMGVSYDFVRWLYGFVDVGMSVNPSMKPVLGFTADAGLGAKYNFNTHWTLFTELDCNFTENHKAWLMMPTASVGVSYCFGITEKDRVRLDIRKHQGQ